MLRALGDEGGGWAGNQKSDFFASYSNAIALPHTFLLLSIAVERVIVASVT